MPNERLEYYFRPQLEGPRLIIGLSGWMDGGEVSTGTVEYLADKFGARKLADFEPAEFYIYNFPGSMEISALFRPMARIEDGIVQSFEQPTNTFSCSEEANLILFNGKEPNLRWDEYTDCIMSVVTDFDVSTICFVGSVASLVPHTREPHYYSTISGDHLRPLLLRNGLSPTNYQGPGSIIHYLATLARDAGVDLVSIVAAIPAYVQGRNIKSIESIVKKLSALLDLPGDFSDLTVMAAKFVKQLDGTVKARPELAEQIRKIEKAYDEQAGNDQMDDLQSWFDKQGIQIDN